MEYPPFVIVVKPSLWLVIYYLLLLAGVGLAFNSLVVAGTSIIFLGLGFLFISFMLYRSYKNIAQARRIRLVNRSWIVSDSDSNIPVFLQSATLWSYLAVMNFNSLDGRVKIAVIVFPGSCSGTEFRKLQTILRHWPVYGRSSSA